MAALGDLFVRVGANISGFQSAMGDVSKTINKTVGQSTRAFSGFDRIGTMLKGFGTQMTAAVTLPIVGAGAAALKFAGDFDGAMREVTSLLGDVTQQEFQSLSDQTLELSRRMGVDAVGSANALYEALSANVPKDNVLAFLEVATATGIAGVTSTKVAVDGLTTVINAYGLEASEAGAVSDAMFTAVNFGKVTFEELASSVGIAASSATTMGISYDDLLGTMAAITLQGRSSSEAFTEIQSAMKALISPNKEMNELLEKTGYSSGKALFEAKGLAGGLQELSKAANGNSQSLADAFGRIEGYNAMLHVTGPGADLVTTALGKMNEKIGATAAAQAEIEKSAPRAWERFKSQLEATAIVAGQALLPIMTKVLDIITPLIQGVGELVKWFGTLPGPVQTAVIAITGLVAAIGPVLFVAGQMASSIAGIATAVTVTSGIISGFPAVFNTGFIGPLTAGQVAARSFIATLGAIGTVAAGVFVGWQIGAWLADMQQAKERVDRFATGLAFLGTKVKALDDDLAAGKITFEQYHVAIENVGRRAGESASKLTAAIDKQAAASKELEAKKIAEAAAVAKSRVEFEKQAKEVLKSADATVKSGRETATATKQQESFNTRMGDFTAVNERARASLENLHPELYQMAIDAAAAARAVDLLGDEMVGAGVDVAELTRGIGSLELPVHPAIEAMRELGITSSASLKDVSDAAGRAYEAIRDDSESTTGEVQAAWQKMTQAKIDYARSIGDNATADALQKQIDAHQKNGEKVTGIWQRTAQQVSTIISDMGKGFAKGIIGLFDNSKNQEIDKQLAEQRAALETATAEYTKHVEDVSAKLAEIPGAYSTAMEELESVTSDKVARLDDDYASSIDKIKSRFEDVTKSARKSLDRQLKDLDDQLEDRKLSYKRATEDANKSYGRDTENLRESLDDKERDYRHWVEEQQLQLRQLEGDNSASAQRQREDIQLALQQRAEDMEDTRADTQLALQREEEDLRLSLDRKRADYESEQAEIAERQAEARAKYQETLASAEEDLKQSIADRQKEYDADKAAAISTYEEAKVAIIAKYEEQTAALKAELAKAATEYDTYKGTIDTKMAELEASHKGPLDRIGQMFKDVFSAAGEALLRFAGEEVMGALFKQLDKLLEKIPGIGGALGGIFGGSTSTPAPVPTVPTTAPVPTVPTTNPLPSGGGASSTAAQVGSTALSTGLSAVTAVAGVVSAVTGVLSMMGVGVQGNMSDSLKGIHNDTTYLAKAFGDMGLKDSLLGMANNFAAYVSSYSGWVHDAWVEMLGNTGMISDLKWYADDTHRRIGDIKGTLTSSLSELTAIKVSLQTMPAPVVNVYVQGDLPDLVTKIKTEIARGVALQGA